MSKEKPSKFTEKDGMTSKHSYSLISFPHFLYHPFLKINLLSNYS